MRPWSAKAPVVVGRLAPRLFCTRGRPPWGAATSVNLFTEFEFCPRQGPTGALGSQTPRWGKPGPGTVGHPEDPKKWRWASRSGRRWRPPGLGGWRSGKRAAGPGTQKAAALREEGNTGHPRNFLLSTSVPFSTRNETDAPVEARLSAAIKRESETMPGAENGTAPIASQRPATKRPTLGLSANRRHHRDGSAMRSGARAST